MAGRRAPPGLGARIGAAVTALALAFLRPGTPGPPPARAEDLARQSASMRDGTALAEMRPIDLPSVAYSVSALATGGPRASLVRPEQVSAFSSSLRPSFVVRAPSPPAAVELYDAEGRSPPQAKAYPFGSKGALELFLQQDLAPGRVYVLLVAFGPGDTRFYAVGVGAKDADDFFFRKAFLDSMAPTAEQRALKKIKWLRWFRSTFPASRHAGEASSILDTTNRVSACVGGRHLAIQTVEEGLRGKAESLRGAMVFRLAVQGRVLPADVEGEVEKVLSLDIPNPLALGDRLYATDPANSTACQIALAVDPGGVLVLSQRLCPSCPLVRTKVEFTWRPDAKLVGHASVEEPVPGTAAPVPRTYRWTLDEPCSLGRRDVPPDDYEVSVSGTVATFRAVERTLTFQETCVWRSLASPAEASSTGLGKNTACRILSVTPKDARFQLLFGERRR